MNHAYFSRAFITTSILLLGACSHIGPENITRVTIPNSGKFELTQIHPAKGYPKYGMAIVDGREILAKDDVVLPSAQSVYLLTHWEIKPGETVLDIGTGSGIQAIFAAEIADHVLATDINKTAVAVAKLNAKRHKLSDKIEVRHGDLFAPVKKDEKFDVILFNINYPYNQETQGLWKVHERFFAGVSDHLKPDGRIYYQSGLLENIPKITAYIKANQLRIVSLRMDAAIHIGRETIVYLIMRDSDLQKNGAGDGN